MRAPLGSLFLLGAATFAGAAPCAGQVSVELASFAGVYVPTSHIIDSFSFSPGDAKGEVRQHTTSALGARITTWLTKRIGIDLSVDYSGAGATSMLLSPPLMGHVTNASARVLVGVTPRSVPVFFALTAGPARIVHGGAAYSNVWLANTSWGTVVGAFGRFRLTRALALRAELDDYIYRFSGTQAPPPLLSAFRGSPLRHDLVCSLGLSLIPFRHGGAAP